MEAILPKDIQAGLDAARVDSLRKSSRLRVHADGVEHKVLRYWDTGFSLDAQTAPQLPIHYAEAGIPVAPRVARDWAADAPAGLITVDAPH